MQTPVRFPLKDNTDFVSTLRKRVDAYFRDHQISKTGDSRMVVKTIVLMTLLFGPYCLMMFGIVTNVWAMLGLSILMGFATAGVGMSVMHDANHGAYASSPLLNRILGHTMELMGSSSLTWRGQHNYFHHTYTNIYELDEDIEDKPFLRLSPHGKWRKYHRFQHWYALFLYSLADLSFIITKDIRQVINYTRDGVFERMGIKNIKREIAIMILGKLVYITYMVVLPLIFLDVTWWQFLIGFSILHAASSLVLTTVFQLAHVVEGPTHHLPAEEGTMENVWAKHQLHTTADFARNNAFITWYVGGLNFQVEHHLFPNICHVHYPEVSKIVEQTAREFGVPHYSFPSFGKALRSHFRVLKRLGNQETEGLVAEQNKVEKQEPVSA